jgi:hypothetical protein
MEEIFDSVYAPVSTCDNLGLISLPICIGYENASKRFSNNTSFENDISSVSCVPRSLRCCFPERERRNKSNFASRRKCEQTKPRTRFVVLNAMHGLSISRQSIQTLHLRRELDDVSAGQTLLIDKLMACCQEVGTEILITVRH